MQTTSADDPPTTPTSAAATTADADTINDDLAVNDGDLHEPEWDTLSGKPIDLQQLLRWGLQHSTRNEDVTTDASAFAKNHEPIDPKWLEIIMGKSDVVRMKDCMDRILDRSANSRLEAYDELELLVEDLDNAKDFIKLKLIDQLVDCLGWGTDAEEDVANTLWIMATIVQNNPLAKQAYLSMNLLPTLLKLGDSIHQKVSMKALYCLSGLLKNNSRAQLEFHRLNGYDILFRRLLDPNGSSHSVCKALNLLTQLMADSPQTVGRYVVRKYRNLITVIVHMADRYPEDANVKSLSTGLIKAILSINPSPEDYSANKEAIRKRFAELDSL